LTSKTQESIVVIEQAQECRKRKKEMYPYKTEQYEKIDKSAQGAYYAKGWITGIIYNIEKGYTKDTESVKRSLKFLLERMKEDFGIVSQDD